MEIRDTLREKYRPHEKQAGEPRADWQESLDLFLAQINPSRVQDGYKPYTHAQIAKKLSDSGVHDSGAAFLLFKRCEGFHSFSKGFTYLTKAKV